MSDKWHGGKGDKRRPMSISEEEYANRWDAIFGTDIKDEPKKDEKNIEKNKK